MTKEKVKKVKKIKETKVPTKEQDYYCVIDKQYTNTKKNEPPLRFVTIRIETKTGKPDNNTVVVDHAILHYSWFDNPDEARQFKKELLQEII